MCWAPSTNPQALLPRRRSTQRRHRPARQHAAAERAARATPIGRRYKSCAHRAPHAHRIHPNQTKEVPLCSRTRLCSSPAPPQALRRHCRAARGPRRRADVDEDALRRFTVPVNVTDMASVPLGCRRRAQPPRALDAVWANAGISVFAPLELTDDAALAMPSKSTCWGPQHHQSGPAAGDRLARLHHHGQLRRTSAYASKAGMEALGNSLRVELADRAVDVGVFHPQWINTVMVTQKQNTRRRFQRLLRKPSGRRQRRGDGRRSRRRVRAARHSRRCRCCTPCVPLSRPAP